MFAGSCCLTVIELEKVACLIFFFVFFKMIFCCFFFFLATVITLSVLPLRGKKKNAKKALFS